MLETGVKAPDFTLLDKNGEQVSLSQFLGKKVVLYCVLNRLEIYELKRLIKEVDTSAFITVSDVSEIIGKHIKKTAIE